jgi:hypothetical protein
VELERREGYLVDVRRRTGAEILPDVMTAIEPVQAIVP